MTSRIQFIDLAKGLCISLVVLYHINKRFDLYPDLFMLLSTFRMPLYFLLSGLFFKEYENFLGFLKRKTNKLLIPFLFFYLITSFLLPNLLYLLGWTVDKTESLGVSGLWAFLSKEQFSNGPIWFLWCLFVLNIIFYVIFLFSKLFGRYFLYVLVLISCIMGCMGMVLSVNHINLPAFIDTALTSTPFFCVGYILRKHTKILYSNLTDKYLLVFVIACFAISYLIGGDCSYKGNHFGISPLFVYISGLSGTLGIIFLAKYLEDIPFFSYWGRYSIMILLTHGLLLQVYIPIVKKIPVSATFLEITLLLVTMFSYNILIPIMKKYLPYVTAQKDVILV